MGFLLLCVGCTALAADPDHIDTTVFSGLITIYAVDNFKDRISQTRYELKLDGDGKTVSLKFADHTDTSDLRSGMQVEIHGRLQTGYIDVERYRIITSSLK